MEDYYFSYGDYRKDRNDYVAVTLTAKRHDSIHNPNQTGAVKLTRWIGGDASVEIVPHESKASEPSLHFKLTESELKALVELFLRSEQLLEMFPQ